MSQVLHLSLITKILIYLRNILALFVLLLFVLFSIFPTIMVYLTKKQSFLTYYAKFAISILMFILGLKVKVENYNKELFKSEQWIIIGNHTSFLDPIILFKVFPGTLRFFYKSGVDRIPFISWALKVSNFISVERNNPRKAEKSIRKAINLIKRQKKDSIGIFPEGTRSLDGRLKRFKRGAFVLSKEHNLPILPAYLMGFYHAMPKGRWLVYPSKLSIEFLRPIPKKIIEEKADKELRDFAYEIFEKIEERVIL